MSTLGESITAVILMVLFFIYFAFVTNWIDEFSQEIDCQRENNVSDCVWLPIPNTEQELLEKYGKES